MTLRRLAAAAALVLLMAGCASAPPSPPEPTPATSNPAGTPEPAAEAPLPDQAAPAPAGKETLYTAASPDQRWRARLAGESEGDGAGYGEIWIDQAAGGESWLVTPRALLSEPARFLWTPDNTLLYYNHDEQPWPGQWHQADPIPRRSRPFVRGLVADHSTGGMLIPSPDGKQLLLTTGHCIGCNKPSTASRTLWLVKRETQAWQQLGIDLQARWDGSQLVTESLPPHMGYSGILFTRFENGHGVTSAPLGLSIQVGGTDYVEFRIFAADAAQGSRPLRVFPALNSQDTYSTWSFRWEDSPPGLYRVEAWAEARPTVPTKSAFDNPMAAYWPEFRHEGGKRWAVVYSPTVRVEPGAQPRQTLTLTRLQMTTPQEGWAADRQGRVYTTADGGATWQNVSPAGLSRCLGRLAPRFVHTFQGSEAAVAMACDSTNEQGLWSEQSGTVRLFRTTDGGQKWTERAINTPFLHAKPAVLQFLDEENGIALVQPKLDYPDSHARGALYATADGGKSWQLAADTDHTLPGAREGSFLTPERGWVGGQGQFPTLHQTEDGGRTWQEVPIDRSDFTQLHWFTAPQFVSPTEGFFTVRGAKEGARLGLQALYATADGGRTWVKRSTRDGERRPVFLTPQVGYVWEYELRTIFWTRDGGRTWEGRPWEINPAGLADVHFVDEAYGFAVDGHLWVTRDGANTWAPLYQQGAQ